MNQGYTVNAAGKAPAKPRWDTESEVGKSREQEARETARLQQLKYAIFSIQDSTRQQSWYGYVPGPLVVKFEHTLCLALDYMQPKDHLAGSMNRPLSFRIF